MNHKKKTQHLLLNARNSYFEISKMDLLPAPFCFQDSVGGSQPLVALFEGANCLLGACMVDVSLCTFSLAQWQVG